MDISAINEKVKDQNIFIKDVIKEVGQVIVGQVDFIERLVLGLLTGGHVLVEGVPGLAKTLAVNTLSDTLHTSFQRIQFTPDLLPADIVGTMIYNQKQSKFDVKKGPIFHNIILADEINRSPAKVQSALLEAMQENQVTIGDETFPLEDIFLVIATQNPIEQEGTYPLPEAQVDRFMMKVILDYPTEIEEKEILERMSHVETPKANAILTPEKILKARQLLDKIYIDDKIKDYIVSLVFASRKPSEYGLGEMKDLIMYGASPRATISLAKCAKAHAFMRGRGYVIPEDIKQIGLDVLRHRIIPSFEGEAEDMTSDMIVKRIFDKIEVP